MKNHLMLAGAAVLSVLGLSACAGYDPTDDDGTDSANGEEVSAAAEEVIRALLDGTTITPRGPRPAPIQVPAASRLARGEPAPKSA
jgi:hypothetical protein